MAMMVWITVKLKDGNLDQLNELADEPMVMLSQLHEKVVNFWKVLFHTRILIISC